MIRFQETAATSLSVAEAFAQLGEFANVQDWDPGVTSSMKTSDQPTGVGTVYALDLLYRGRKMEMEYRVTEFDVDRRLVVEGSGGMVEAVDTIEFEPTPDGTKVTYIAELSLTGIARLVEPLMKSRFAEVVRSGGDGLRGWLKELESELA